MPDSCDSGTLPIEPFEEVPVVNPRDIGKGRTFRQYDRNMRGKPGACGKEPGI